MIVSSLRVGGLDRENARRNERLVPDRCRHSNASRPGPGLRRSVNSDDNRVAARRHFRGLPFAPPEQRSRHHCRLLNINRRLAEQKQGADRRMTHSLLLNLFQLTGTSLVSDSIDLRELERRENE